MPTCVQVSARILSVPVGDGGVTEDLYVNSREELDALLIANGVAEADVVSTWDAIWPVLIDPDTGVEYASAEAADNQIYNQGGILKADIVAAIPSGIEISFHQTDDAFNASSLPSPQTFSAMDIGTANSSRVVFVGISMRPRAGTSVSGVTIGGEIASLVDSDVTQTFVHNYIYAATVATGTTGDVVVTYSGNPYWFKISTFSSIGASTTAYDTAFGSSSNGTIDVNSGGCILAIGGTTDEGPNTTTWTGVTESFDELVGGGSQADGASGGIASNLSAETGRSIGGIGGANNAWLAISITSA